MDLAHAISRKKYTPPAGRVKLSDDDDEDEDDDIDDDDDGDDEDEDEVTSNSREVSTNCGGTGVEQGISTGRSVGVITRAVPRRLSIPRLHGKTTRA